MRPRRWVLVADQGYEQNRTALAVVRALAAGGYRPAVTASTRWSLAAASRFCERTVPVPADEAEFALAVRGELAVLDYVVAMPTSDSALLALGAPVRQLVDKRTLAEAAASAGIDTPPTRSFGSAEDLRAAQGELEYPIVVKPPLSRFRPIKVSRPHELDAALERTAPMGDGPIMVQPYITDPLRAVSGVLWDGRMVAVVHQQYRRTWPPDCGGASAAFTSEPDHSLEEQLATLLSGHEGIFMAQFAGPYLLDCNPRAYGSLPLAVAAGANLVAIYCDLVAGERAPREPVRAHPGFRYRWLEGDLRHLARCVRERSMPIGSAALEAFPRRGTAQSTETWRDPRPALRRLAYALSRRR
jgi:predicted ATP-grasp superfamily ATP-dependent carboligase